jgi:N-acyl-D-aspartate/D-glutamate deacylase
MFDTLIRKAKIVDGSGNPWFLGDVGIVGDKIAALGPAGKLAGAKVIEAEGLVLAPGFIDIQSHSIIPLLRDGRCLSKITQGVTTEIMGEGWTPAPFGGEVASPFPQSWVGKLGDSWVGAAQGWSRFGDWLESLEGRVSPNVGSFLAGGTLREYACGLRMGPAQPHELDLMRRVMAEAMEDGAMGVAYALIYPPDEFATTEEIIEVCKVAAEHGGIYITHMRSEGDGLMEGLEETLRIAREAKIPAEIYHLKASGERNWHKMPGLIERIHQARQEGLDITADMYPYAASGTGLDAILPTWVSEGGKFFERLEDPAVREKIRHEVLHGAGDMNTSRADTILPVGFQRSQHKHYIGKFLSEIAAMRREDWVDCVINLLRAERQRISTIYFSMTEDNLRLQVGQPWIKFSTDAGGLNPDHADTPTHPRAYGSYPRVLGKYVREEKLLSLEEAIRKMTSAVATRLSIRGRGLIAPGYFADLVLFDPETIKDHATFEDSHQLSTGVKHLWVNGVQVIAEGTHTGALPGRFVRGPGEKANVHSR